MIAVLRWCWHVLVLCRVDKHEWRTFTKGYAKHKQCIWCDRIGPWPTAEPGDLE